MTNKEKALMLFKITDQTAVKDTIHRGLIGEDNREGTLSEEISFTIKKQIGLLGTPSSYKLRFFNRKSPNTCILELSPGIFLNEPPKTINDRIIVNSSSIEEISKEQEKVLNEIYHVAISIGKRIDESDPARNGATNPATPNRGKPLL